MIKGGQDYIHVDFKEDWCPGILGKISPEADYLESLANIQQWERDFVWQR